ncbi:hypothetical protein FDENT_4 [Fusarium denticulatum]|uniref:Uncharacterized protein n=1 Tax=Fusarium denticulatum TaxID=48507 RepID=A0A8H5XLI2_9HYPO|nr:hypothetical protein FDENT_4 [Fusarium denticulatum]
MNINSTPTAQSLETDLSGAASRSHGNAVRSIGESANEIGLGTQGRTVYATEHMLARVPFTEVSELRRDEKDERVARYDVQISPMSASVSIVPLLKKNKFEDIAKGGETI